MEKIFEFFSDPGHGWVKVEKSLLAKLGIADKITPYSYQHGDYAYLEEDCDASLFADEYEKQTGLKFKFESHICNYSSAIRRYEPYKKPAELEIIDSLIKSRQLDKAAKAIYAYLDKQKS